MDAKIKLSLDQAMQLAIDEAYKGAAFVSPNPKVGCVVLDSSGYLLAKGHHQFFGGPHAEVEALKNLSNDQLKGASLFVTLEPCAHEGKTPSCAKKIATLPIAQVVYGLQDPNPLVAGQGAQIIRDAGIQTLEYQGFLKSELFEVCEEFLVNFTKKRVFVAMKVAQSLDGKIALKNGQSQWITGPESREEVQRIRSNYDAVLVGHGTLVKDNPSLNIRIPGLEKINWAVILGSQKVPKEMNVFKVRPADKVVSLNGELPEILDQIWKLGIRSVLVEGGSQVFSSFIKSGFVDRLHLFTAPIVIGQGMGWTEDFEILNLESIARPQRIKTQMRGIDTYQSLAFGADHQR